MKKKKHTNLFINFPCIFLILFSPLGGVELNNTGAVDVQALIMSLKSGMRFEVTNALNTLSTLTKVDSSNLHMTQCPELLDVLLDLTEETFINWNVVQNAEGPDRWRDSFNGSTEGEGASVQHCRR